MFPSRDWGSCVSCLLRGAQWFKCFFSFVSPHPCHHPQSQLFPLEAFHKVISLSTCSLPSSNVPRALRNWDPLSQHKTAKRDAHTPFSNSLRMLHGKQCEWQSFLQTYHLDEARTLGSLLNGEEYPFPCHPLSSLPQLFGEVHSLSITSHSWTLGLLLHYLLKLWFDSQHGHREQSFGDPYPHRYTTVSS